MLTLGPYTVSTLVTHSFGLDGGSMFGAVPKVLWQRKITADDKNRIPLVSRLLLLRSEDRLVVADIGCGEKWSDKEISIYNFQSQLNAPLTEVLSEVTDVVLTHFHFDHAGGVSYVDGTGEVKLTCPDATHYVQSKHWEYAKNPVVREQASFIEANIAPLEKASLKLTEDGEEILPGITVHSFSGHTHGYQAVTVTDGITTLAFPSDLIPTAHHVPLVWIMGYDICAERTVEEKRAFLEKAVKENWLLVFAHDIDTAAGRVGKSASGKFELVETVEIPSFAS